MKKLLILLTLFFTTWNIAFAYDFMVDDIYYSFNKDRTQVGVTYRDGYKYSGNVTIPSRVNYNGTNYTVYCVGVNAFSACSGLTSVTIPNSVTILAIGAFRNCTGLTSVTIPNSNITIGEEAFYGCSNLSRVVWSGNSIKTEVRAFPSSLKTVEIASDFKTPTSWPFGSSVTNLLYNSTNVPLVSETKIPSVNFISFGSNAKTIPANFAKGITTLTLLSIDSGVTNIGDYAFQGCTGLTTVTIPGSVKTVGTYAFSGCTGLTKITLNNGIEELKLRSLSGCKKLTSVTIPNSVKIIREKAFCDNTAVTSVNLGTGVTAIEYMAFANNNSLKTVTANSVVPPATSVSYAFNGTTPVRSSITLKFPIASYYAYSTAHEFEEFNFDFAIGTEQGPGGFSGSGAGTENDPYLIFNPIQLYNVRNFNGKAGVVFKLMADIDLTDFIADNNPNNGWEPIGTNSSPFMGKFYGDNHKISGFKISRTNDYIGLFGCTNGATINNLTVEGTTVSGGAYTGVVAGAAVNTTINNVTGNASVNGKSYVGGFAGLSHGSTLSKCYHTGTVTATDSIVGGFIGNIAKGTLTTGSHKGNVKGGLKTGGFAGNCLSSTEPPLLNRELYQEDNILADLQEIADYVQ